ncbi:MAG: molybdopterin-synthase adenylyltransferase MoeB [Thaumarchaeota archaeon]|nr:molybdopterin-synthase adenylyltransferase MoeB [Nitrososphaerota archaeon]
MKVVPSNGMSHPSILLTASEGQRYSRHLVLPEVGIEGQRRLKGSSVLVVGMGGLGIPAAVYLASAGVGQIGIVDNDVVEMTNLQRQFLFNEADLGKKKVEVAAARLRQVNPNVKIVTSDRRLDSSNALDIMRDYEVVVDATDNLPSRYLINDACVMLGKPDVYASVLGFDGQASVFWSKQGPCYRCLYPEPPPPEMVQSCETAGVLGVLPGVMGGLQAIQAIQILLGRGSPLVGRLLIFSGMDTSFDEVRIKKDSHCALCGPNPTVTKLVDYEEFCGTKKMEHVEFDVTPKALKASIDRGEKPVLLDVRETWEYELCHLEGTTLIPLGQLQARMNELDRAKEVVVYCHTGIRSTQAVALLRQAGFSNARNLQGGIDSWARQIDPKMQRY